MSPTALPKGMTLPEYLGQADVWIDGRSRTVFKVAELDGHRRGYASRELARAATGYISLMETMALINGDLVEMVGLIATSPRAWIIETRLYRALSADVRPAGGGTVITVHPAVSVSTPRPRPVPPDVWALRRLAS
jgi:hypothetical protein